MTQQTEPTRRSALKASGILGATLFASFAATKSGAAPARDPVEYHTAQLTKALQERHGGQWFSAINDEHGFAIVSRK